MMKQAMDRIVSVSGSRPVIYVYMLETCLPQHSIARHATSQSIQTNGAFERDSGILKVTFALLWIFWWLKRWPCSEGEQEGLKAWIECSNDD